MNGNGIVGSWVLFLYILRKSLLYQIYPAKFREVALRFINFVAFIESILKTAIVKQCDN